MSVIDDMIIKLGFEADGAIAEMAKTAAALADMSAPAIRLACFDHARQMAPRDYYATTDEGATALINDAIREADAIAAFVLHGTVPAKN